MKKSFKISFLFLVTGMLFTACDLSSTSGEDLVAQAEQALNDAGISATSNDPAPAPAPATPTVTSSSNDDHNDGFVPGTGPVPNGVGNGFLWKPHSESTGSLVILTPQATRGRTERVATISGAFGSESAPMRHEHHNGGRPHFYFSRHGREYGTNITVTVPLTDGSVYTAVVPNGAVRTE